MGEGVRCGPGAPPGFPGGDSGLPRKESWPPAGDGRALNPGGVRSQTPPAPLCAPELLFGAAPEVQCRAISVVE